MKYRGEDNEFEGSEIGGIGDIWEVKPIALASRCPLFINFRSLENF